MTKYIMTEYTLQNKLDKRINPDFWDNNLVNKQRHKELHQDLYELLNGIMVTIFWCCARTKNSERIETFVFWYHKVLSSLGSS